MKRFYFRKLVRDKIVDRCVSDPQVNHTEYRVLEGVELRQEIAKKIVEELDEIPLEKSGDPEALKELADLYAAYSELRDTLGFDEREVAAAADEKALESGGFKERHYIEFVDLTNDSKWVDIFRAQPDKYQEASSTPTFITGNSNKADYLSRQLGVEVKHQKIDLEEIQSVDLHEIVEHKLRQAYEVVKSPVLVEDVSLVFNALGDLPGPYIKWFLEHAGEEACCRMLDGLKDRSAIIRCTFGYYDGQEITFFDSETPGTISDHPRGKNGFGFDTIFIGEGYDITRAEMTQQENEQTYASAMKPFTAVREFLVQQGIK